MAFVTQPNFDLFPRTIGPFNEIAVSNFLQTFLIASENFDARQSRNRRQRTRTQWVVEECQELELAIGAGDPGSIIRELADVVYVTVNDLATNQDVDPVHALEAFLIGAAQKWIS